MTMMLSRVFDCGRYKHPHAFSGIHYWFLIVYFFEDDGRQFGVQ